MTDLYFCYRFQSVLLEAWSLAKAMEPLIGRNRITVDAKDVPPGADVRTYLEKRLESCRVMLVLIDRNRPLSERVISPDYRLQLQNASVRGRREVEIAMRLGKSVVPVLLGGNVELDGSDDPSALRLLAHLQPFHLTSTRCPEQARQLLEGLRSGLGWTNRHHPLLEYAFRAALFRPDLQARVLEKDEDTASTAARFCLECLVEDNGSSQTATQLFEAYCEWCALHQVEPDVIPLFCRAVSNMGFKKERIAGRIRYLNVKLVGR